MLPLQLTMSAFGCYANVCDIDFTAFSKCGIYLITGNTGAGKTTIFDAIAFALYGQASGDFRTAMGMRSKYASPTVGTFVRLVFSYHQKQYTILRSPQQERPKSRGDGFTLKPAEVELLLPTGRTLTKTKEVQLAIESILGITREQFVQIAMIAQGDFLKLLLAKTEERSEIFRRIFHTKCYEQFQQQIKSKTLEKKESTSTKQHRYQQAFSEVLLTQNSPYLTQLEQAQSLRLPYDDATAFLGEVVKIDGLNLEKSVSLLEHHQQKLTQLSTAIGATLEHRHTKELLAKAQSLLPTKQADYQITEQALQTELEKIPQQENLQQSIATLTVILPQYMALSTLENAMQKSQSLLVQTQQQLEHSDIKCNEKIAQLQKAKTALEPLLSNERLTQTCQTELLACKQKQHAMSSLQATFAQVQSLQKKLEQTHKIYQTASHHAAMLARQYEQMQKAYLDAQAGVLATGLIAGQPCPVCGACEHPNLAILPQNVPQKSQVEAAKNAYQTAQNQAVSESDHASGMNGQLKSAQDLLHRQGKELLADLPQERWYDTMQDSLLQLKQQIALLESALKKQQERQAHKAELSAQINTLEVEIQQQKTEHLTRTVEKTKLETKLQSDAKYLAELQKQLPFPTEPAVCAEINALKEQKNLLQQLLQQAKQRFDTAKQQLEKVQTEIATLQQRLAQKKPAREADLARLEQQKTICETMLQKEQARQQELFYQNKNNLCAFAKISALTKQLKAEENELEWLLSLCNTVNGEVSGKEKMKLETYVQIAYFDRILVQANHRLLQMSSMQYELVRKKNGSLRSQSGLDLSIIDHYNDTSRDVSTLSGGESFLASLSLALGMSDEMQQYAGGIVLDSMFIDEGFGSLDESTLSQAMQALLSIAEQNRLIGIISHVEKLKETVPNQIIVQKQPFEGGARVFLSCE